MPALEYHYRVGQMALSCRHSSTFRPRKRAGRDSKWSEKGARAAPSASASKVGGTSRPSALAVLRLTTSSNFIGAYAGRIRRLLPFEYAIDVGSGPPEDINGIGRI